jgi:hypothetical protein
LMPLNHLCLKYPQGRYLAPGEQQKEQDT